VAERPVVFSASIRHAIAVEITRDCEIAVNIIVFEGAPVVEVGRAGRRTLGKIVKAGVSIVGRAGVEGVAWTAAQDELEGAISHSGTQQERQVLLEMLASIIPRERLRLRPEDVRLAHYPATRVKCLNVAFVIAVYVRYPGRWDQHDAIREAAGG